VTDRRIIGTWRSDKRKTLRELRTRGDVKPGYLVFMTKATGKLTIEYRRTTAIISGVGETRRVRYAVLARDDESVVLESYDDLFGANVLTHIFFEGEGSYWVPVSGKYREWFRRIS
jgi:hypothetical protein